ncbi:MAG: glutamate 5-kinase [Lachnospiraceae bacterium]|jgi:glutamate 5-kinase|nr:glutamate 5-kinase [Lachnospiraceae bacterium]
MENIRKFLLNKKRVVVKIGSSSLHHPETGDLDYAKLDILIRELCNMRNSGIDVVLVSSGAIAVGKKAVQIDREDKEDHPIAVKQACAAIGQARLMMIYQKLFAEYNQVTAQVLMTKNTVVDDLNRYNVQNTFTELFKLGVIPVVNENDSVATYEIKFGDNDSLSAIVASIVKADMLILLSDIDGLYSDDPRKNPKAEFISEVDDLTDEYFEMGKESTGSDSGTGGMSTKLQAAKIATSCGIDMVITSAKDVKVIHKIISGKDIGTVFRSKRDDGFDLPEFVREMNQ